MKRQLELETLEERRHSLRLILLYKVVEGLVLALPTADFVTTAKPKKTSSSSEKQATGPGLSKYSSYSIS
jgi:hypothetical protein